MNRCLRTPLATQQLDGAVGNDLVGVHVGGGPRAGLEDVEWKMVVVGLPGHLSRRLTDGIGQLLVEQPELDVHTRCLPFDQPQGGDKPPRKAQTAHLEIETSALGLRTPVGRLRHLDISEAVFLDACDEHRGDPPSTQIREC
jgi:hypothetical protein